MTTSQHGAIQHLMALANRNPDTSEQQWFNAAVDRWIRQPPAGRTSLEFSLGLSTGQPGQACAATVIQMELRNRHLYHAVQDIQQQHPNLSLWSASGCVANEIRKLRRLPIHLLLSGQRIPQNAIEYHLLQAFALQMELPVTQQGVFNVAKSMPTIDFGFLMNK